MCYQYRSITCHGANHLLFFFLFNFSFPARTSFFYSFRICKFRFLVGTGEGRTTVESIYWYIDSMISTLSDQLVQYKVYITTNWSGKWIMKTTTLMAFSEYHHIQGQEILWEQTEDSFSVFTLSLCCVGFLFWVEELVIFSRCIDVFPFSLFL